MNLLKETIDLLRANGKGPNDIVWCGSADFYFTWDEFAIVADVKYDDGFGCAEVAGDLKVVGKDFWLERHEYDGSEWWEFKSHPSRPKDHVVPKSVIRDGYEDALKDMQS